MKIMKNYAELTPGNSFVKIFLQFYKPSTYSRILQGSVAVLFNSNLSASLNIFVQAYS